MMSLAILSVKAQEGLLSCPDENHPHAIDLGVSNTLWSCCNMGAMKPEELGGHYALGELQEKDEYTYENYIFGGVKAKGSDGVVRKLGNEIRSTYKDIAHMKWRDKWTLPTTEQFSDLRKCKRRRITYNGVSGVIVIGPNENRIFIPFAGTDGKKTNGDNCGQYWSASIVDGCKAFYFTVGDCSDGDCAYAYHGLSIRPIMPK